MPLHSRLRGFSLIEAIIAMTVMGAIGGVVAVVMKAPIAAYFDTKQRVVLTDTADTALRRIT